MFSCSSSAHERCDESFCKLCCATRCCSQGKRSSGGASLAVCWRPACSTAMRPPSKNIVLAMPEPSRLLPVYEEARAALMALRENIVQTHAVYNTWAQQDEALALKRAAKGALRKLWSFHEARSLAAAAALRRVAVLLVTGDVALKIFCRCATPGSPAARLLRENSPQP